MTNHKNILVPQKIATLSLLALGAFVTIRGFYFAVNQEDVIHESEFYTTLYRVMPMWIWGALLIVFGFLIILASCFFGKRSTNNISNYCMLIGGAGGAIIYFFIASASIYNTINWISPAQFITTTAWLCFISFLGGSDIYARR